MFDLIEMDGRFENQELENLVLGFKKRGFQEWPEWVGLSKTQFTSEAKFETVDDKDAKTEERRILHEVEKQTDKKWQVRSVVVLGEQKQKRLRVFLREKNGDAARTELIESLKTLNSKINGGNGLTVLREMVIPSLESGDWHVARVDCEQQRDKLEHPAELVEILKEGLYSEGEKTPWDRFVVSDD